ncbi:MAG TPA: hypothetical protein VII66_00855 [Gemmatimonadaceae bacterium]
MRPYAAGYYAFAIGGVDLCREGIVRDMGRYIAMGQPWLAEGATMTTLGEDYPKMQAHVRELLASYREIGPAGAFGAMMIEQVLRHADEAAASGDVAEMIRCYQAMKECE